MKVILTESQYKRVILNESAFGTTALIAWLLWDFSVKRKIKIGELPQYSLEVGGDIFIEFIKFLNYFNYSVDPYVLRLKWDSIVKIVLNKYYKEGGILYPELES